MTQAKRGFAAMDPERQREIARAGGRASHERGSAHEWDAQEASRAGRAAHARGQAHEWTSAEAAEAGRRGGRAGRRQRTQPGQTPSTEDARLNSNTADEPGDQSPDPLVSDSERREREQGMIGQERTREVE